MKQVIKISLIVVAAVLLFVVVWKLTYTGDGTITPGTYKITDFDRYPDACIEVKEDTIQFSGIDLNEIYQKEQIRKYKELVEKRPEFAIPDEEVQKYSDLNTLMVDNPYPIDYELHGDSKTGTFTYAYNFYTSFNFGFGIEYDTLRKTLRIEHYIQELTFKK